jgi:predicted DCC family thiol-disulfide oxidoreductase YuxK
MNIGQASCQETSSLKIVCDDRCKVVRHLATIVRRWDKEKKFEFVERTSSKPIDQQLFSRLDNSQWSLLLVDGFDDTWEGPESIPIILKNLPFGRIAAVLYILPGTSWITQKLYLVISRHRKIFAQHQTVA